MQFSKEGDCSWWSLLGSWSLPCLHIRSSSSTFSIFLSFCCLWVSISATFRYFWGAISWYYFFIFNSSCFCYIVICASSPRYQDCYWLGQPWAADARLNTYQQLPFPPVMLLQLWYKFLEVFSNTAYATLSKIFMFTFTKFLTSSPQASLPYSDRLSVSASWFILFPVQPYSQMEYRSAEPK